MRAGGQAGRYVRIEVCRGESRDEKVVETCILCRSMSMIRTNIDGNSCDFGFCCCDQILEPKCIPRVWHFSPEHAQKCVQVLTLVGGVKCIESMKARC